MTTLLDSTGEYFSGFSNAVDLLLDKPVVYMDSEDGLNETPEYVRCAIAKIKGEKLPATPMSMPMPKGE